MIDDQTKEFFQGALLNFQFLCHMSKQAQECDESGGWTLLHFEQSQLSLMID